MKELSIEDVAGGYDLESGTCRDPIVLYSEMDASGEVAPSNYTTYYGRAWRFTEDSFEVEFSTRHVEGPGYPPSEGRYWTTATNVERDASGKVTYFEINHGRMSFYRCEDKRIRHIPGSYYEGKVTLTFH